MSACRTREKGEQQLEDIIRSGVHTFISLQVLISMVVLQLRLNCQRQANCFKMSYQIDGIEDNVLGQ